MHDFNPNHISEMDSICLLSELADASGEKQPAETETARNTPLMGSWELELSGMI